MINRPVSSLHKRSDLLSAHKDLTCPNTKHVGPCPFPVWRNVGIIQKTAYPSVGGWEQLHCFFFARGRRRQAGARPERRRETPSMDETVELLPHASGGVDGSGVSH